MKLVAAIREGQPPGVFVRDSSLWLVFGWQHGLEEPVGILLVWETMKGLTSTG